MNNHAHGSDESFKFSLKVRRVRSPDGSSERPPKMAKTEVCLSAEEEKRRADYRSNHLKRMKRLRARHCDNFLELCFLQDMGNIVDFPTWKRKPPVYVVQSLRANRLDSDDESDEFPELSQTPDVRFSDILSLLYF